MHYELRYKQDDFLISKFDDLGEAKQALYRMLYEGNLVRLYNVNYIEHMTETEGDIYEVVQDAYEILEEAEKNFKELCKKAFQHTVENKNNF